MEESSLRDQQYRQGDNIMYSYIVSRLVYEAMSFRFSLLLAKYTTIQSERM
jgi:hypothetical protein